MSEMYIPSVHIYNMPFDMIFIYPFITYQAGRVRAGVPTKAVENQIFIHTLLLPTQKILNG